MVSFADVQYCIYADIVVGIGEWVRKGPKSMLMSYMDGPFD
jgi:hypothetical protein